MANERRVWGGYPDAVKPSNPLDGKAATEAPYFFSGVLRVTRMHRPQEIIECFRIRQVALVHRTTNIDGASK